MPTDTAVQHWTQEQVERLARFMGCNVWEPGADVAGTYTVYVEGLWVCHGNSPLCDQVLFSPFTDAGSDYLVLQRAREVWAGTYRGSGNEPWYLFAESVGRGCWYEVGVYASAVLAVLDRQETSRCTDAVVEWSKAVEGLSDATRPASMSISALVDALLGRAERDYLRRHTRLPGSTRTARMRKKRVDLVMRAFWQDA